MVIGELVSQLEGVAPDSTDPAIDWDHRGRLWSQLEAEAQNIIKVICPAAWCTAQEWDNRLDCLLRLNDGRIIGEMILLSEITPSRLKEAASRLGSYAKGEDVSLVDPILSPIFIGRGSSNDR